MLRWSERMRGWKAEFLRLESLLTISERSTSLMVSVLMRMGSR